MIKFVLFVVNALSMSMDDKKSHKVVGDNILFNKNKYMTLLYFKYKSFIIYKR